MVSPFVAQMISTHDEFIGAICQECGRRAFTQSGLRTAGIEVPKHCSMNKLHARGVIERVSKDNHFRNTWRLSPQVVDYYAAREVTI